MYPESYLVETGRINSPIFQVLPELFSESLGYTIVAQNAIEVQDTQNAPAVSMGAFLAVVGRMNIFPTISIYGYDRKHARLLYMNAAALRVWKTMGMPPEADRDPVSTAALSRACVRSAIP
jgi:hypothetical protein